MRGLALAVLAAATLMAAADPQATAKKSRQILEAGLKQRDPDGRREAVVAVGLLGRTNNSTALLLPMLRDVDVPVRIAALSTLAEIRDPASFAAVTASLDDAAPEVALAAAKALWEMKQPVGREVLLEILEGERKTSSGMIKTGIRSHMRLLKTPKSALLFAVRQGIGFVPVPGIGEGFWALQTLLFDADFSPRASVLLLLANDKHPDAKRAIREGFDDKDWSVRAAAVQAAAMRVETDMRDQVSELVDDDKAKVRYRAAAAYLRLSAKAPGRPTTQKLTEPKATLKKRS